MKPLLCWDNQCYSAGVEKLTGIKTSIIKVKSSGKCFLRVSRQRLFQQWPRLLTLVSQVALVSKASRGHGEALRLDRVRGRGGHRLGCSLRAVETPTMKRSWRGAEV